MNRAWVGLFLLASACGASEGNEDAGRSDSAVRGDAGQTLDAGPPCEDGLTRCGASCVDLTRDDAACGSCDTVCSAVEYCEASECRAGVGALVLSEVHNRSPRYFELYNGTDAAISLEDHALQWADGAGNSGEYSFPASVSIPSGAFIAIVEGESPDRDGTLFIGEPIPEYESIGVRLYGPESVGIDFVRTGTSPIVPPTGTTWSGENAMTPSSALDQSLVRDVRAPDTNSAADWTLSSPSSRGGECSFARCGGGCVDLESDLSHCGSCGETCGAGELCLAGACTPGRGAVWISEYRRFHPAGVELHNPTGEVVDLAGYRLEVSSDGASESYTIADRTLAPGEFLALYAGSGPNDARSEFTGLDGERFAANVEVALFDPDGTAVDYVPIGSIEVSAPGGAAWNGDTMPPVGGSDISRRRDLSALDSDSSGDFVLGSPSSFGSSCSPGTHACGADCARLAEDPRHCGACGVVCEGSQSCFEGHCVHGSGALVISEIDASTIEVMNGTGAAIDLAGYTLEWTTDGGSGSFTVPSARTLAPGAAVRFAEGDGSEGDLPMPGVSLLYRAHIAVALRDPGGTAIDFVRTEGSSAPAPAYPRPIPPPSNRSRATRIGPIRMAPRTSPCRSRRHRTRSARRVNASATARVRPRNRSSTAVGAASCARAAPTARADTYAMRRSVRCASSAATHPAREWWRSTPASAGAACARRRSRWTPRGWCAGSSASRPERWAATSRPATARVTRSRVSRRKRARANVRSSTRCATRCSRPSTARRDGSEGGSPVAARVDARGPRDPVRVEDREGSFDRGGDAVDVVRLGERRKDPSQRGDDAADDRGDMARW
jgi:hypothetical protein